MTYTGLDQELKLQVFTRDTFRCRWCGATNQGLDVHHISYRRGLAEDVIENLISLCRRHHDFVHGARNAIGETILKRIAQAVLCETIATPGVTGSAIWRQMKMQWAREGRCMHGEALGECFDCGLLAASLSEPQKVT